MFNLKIRFDTGFFILSKPWSVTTDFQQRVSIFFFFFGDLQLRNAEVRIWKGVGL